MADNEYIIGFPFHKHYTPLLPSAHLISVYSLLVYCFLMEFMNLVPRFHYPCWRIF